MTGGPTRTWTRPKLQADPFRKPEAMDSSWQGPLVKPAAVRPPVVLAAGKAPDALGAFRTGADPDPATFGRAVLFQPGSGPVRSSTWTEGL